MIDLWSMKLLVWLLGSLGELLDSHLFFFDRYSDLADYHRLKGRAVKADRLAARAQAAGRKIPVPSTEYLLDRKCGRPVPAHSVHADAGRRRGGTQI